MSLRLDRLLSIYIFRHLSKLTRSKELHIPILMYHSISDTKEDGIHPYYRVNTSPAVFAEHMKYLHANHYKVITLDQVLERLNSDDNNETFIPLNPLSSREGWKIVPSPLAGEGQGEGGFSGQSKKYAAITFDDGFLDFYTEAFPILQQYGFPATVFLPAGLIGDQHGTFKEKELMTWSEVRNLNKKGVVFGSHTVTHRQLKLIRRDEVEYEIKHSKEIIEDNLGEQVESFSYPYAFPQEDKEFIIYLKERLLNYGYLYGVSTRIGSTSLGDSGLFMKRIPVNSCDDLMLLEAKLKRGFDWLYAIQKVSKILRAGLNE